MNFDELMEQIKNPVDLTGNFDAADIEKNKIYGILACIPPLFFLPLVAAKDSAYGKFCANQGLTITILSVLAGAIPAILGFIPFIGGLLGALVSLVLGLATLAAFCFEVYMASQGKVKPIPIVGQMLDVFK